MNLDEVYRLVSELNAQCTQPLVQSTKQNMLQQITQRIKSLSKTSKMPGYSWSISTNHCITGSKLANISGTVCSVCYAKKGRYRFRKVQSALDARLNAWRNDPDWTILQAIRLHMLRETHFRWFDSGDLQSTKMLNDICAVARLAPQVMFWLPTREQKIVNSVADIPQNLIIRLSSNILNKESQKPSSLYASVFYTHKEDAYNCPACQQNNSCGSCRACWDKSIKHIVYKKH